MPSLNRNEKVTCDNCSTQITELNLARHKKRCSGGKLSSTQCPNFSTKSQNDLNYHIAQKHSALKPAVTFKCKNCYEGFPGFYALHQHKNTQHGFPMKTTSFGPDDIINAVNIANPKEELCSCQQFLVDSELKRVRHKVSNCAIENLNSKIVGKKLDLSFNNPKCAAKAKLVFGSILRKIEVGGFTYFYAHENNTPLDRSKLVCTREDLANIEDFHNKIDVIESCSRERMNTKLRFYKLTKLTVIAALFKDFLMGCKDLSEPNLS